MLRISMLALVGVAIASPTKLPSRAISGTKYIFSFGDSYSQTGFDVNSTAPSASNPIGNPAFPGYTTDNGINWIGHLVETYNTSLTLNYNFAYGGAVVNASLVTPYESDVLTLVDQTAEFTSNLSPAPTDVPWTGENSLFALWFGVNDIGNTYYESNSTAITELVLDSYFAEAQKMYDAGGRYFLFLTVPPIQDTPLMVDEGTSAQSSEAAAITIWNSELTTRASYFKGNNTGSTTWVYDTQTPFNTAIADPTAYGATDATCYNSDGTTCLWWNNYHPGQAIQNLVAEGIVSELTGTFF